MDNRPLLDYFPEQVRQAIADMPLWLGDGLIMGNFSGHYRLIGKLPPLPRDRMFSAVARLISVDTMQVSDFVILFPSIEWSDVRQAFVVLKPEGWDRGFVTAYKPLESSEATL